MPVLLSKIKDYRWQVRELWSDETRMKLCIDLCSGLGGFSQAFKASEFWEVITVDINPEFNPSILADVRNVKKDDIEQCSDLRNLSRYEKKVMLMSPPCQFFSRAPGLGAVRKGTADAITIVAACILLVEEILPDGFLLENPLGSYLHFFIGKPNFHVRLGGFGYKTIKPTAFWGNINFLQPDSPKKGKSNAFSNFASDDPAERAKMPFALSQSILEVCDSLP